MQANNTDIEMLFDKNSHYREEKVKKVFILSAPQTILQIFIKCHQ